jgi:hypothetical protein
MATERYLEIVCKANLTTSKKVRQILIGAG